MRASSASRRCWWSNFRYSCSLAVYTGLSISVLSFYGIGCLLVFTRGVVRNCPAVAEVVVAERAIKVVGYAEANRAHGVKRRHNLRREVSLKAGLDALMNLFWRWHCQSAF